MDNLSVIVAIVVVLVSVIFFLFKRKRKGTTFVLYGPTLAGKTALFYRLKQGKFVSSVSSMKENSGEFVWQGDESQQKRNTVDIPGHGRLNWRLKDFLPSTKCIIFVVDAAAFGRAGYCKEAGAMLLDVLSDSLVDAGIPVIIACNKSDDLLAVSKKRVKALLEVEVNAIAKARSKNPNMHEESSSEQAVIEGEIKFDEKAIQVVTTSVKKGELKDLFDAINKQ